MFTAEGPDSVKAVPCPTCAILLPVPAQARQSATVYSAPPRQHEMREVNWIAWIAGAFAAIWIIVIVTMLLLFRRPAPPVATVPPPPIPVATAPAKQPLFEVNPSPVVPPATVPLVAVPPKPPPELRIVPKAAGLTDDDVTASIKKGIDFLLSNFEGDQLKKTLSTDTDELDGMDALCVYALLHCSQSTRDERLSPGSPQMRKMLTRLKAMPMVSDMGWHSPIVYGRSLRAAALALYDRMEDRSTLSGDVQWLINAAWRGAYTYDDVYERPGTTVDPSVPPRPGVHQTFPFNWDNSNSQYGLLGVWSGAEVGVVVPIKYWKDVARHWAECQHPDGTWGYSLGAAETRYSMTCAGIAAMAVTRDYLDLAGELRKLIQMRLSESKL